MNENNGSTTSRTIADKHTVYAYQKTSAEIINRMSEEVKELIRMHNARTGENITTNFTLEGGSAHYSDSFAPLLTGFNSLLYFITSFLDNPFGSSVAGGAGIALALNGINATMAGIGTLMTHFNNVMKNSGTIKGATKAA